MFFKNKKAASIILAIIFILGSIFTVYLGKKVVEKINLVVHQLDGLGDQIATLEHINNSVDRNFTYAFDYSWTKSTPPLVAHALGGIDEKPYTNSLEAFRHNYDLGHRVFEVDLLLSYPENTLIAAHDSDLWQEQVNEDIPMNYSNFMSRKLYGSYTTLDYSDIIDFMIAYPDVYVITDTKFTDKTSVYLQFAQLVQYALNTDPTVLNRLVPQVYHEDMLDWIMDIYPFQSTILTVYQLEWTEESIYEICRNTGIKFVALYYTHISPEMVELWKDLDIMIACYTLDDQVKAEKLFDMGVDYIYTDFLNPSQFE